MGQLMEEARKKELERREREMQKMSICEQLHFVREIICEDFCKYSEEYFRKYSDPDRANDMLDKEVCSAWCPFMKL